MRMGMFNNRKLPPHKFTAYGLIGLGAIIMLLSMPLFVYAAVLGGLIVYLGYSMRHR